MKAQLDPRSDWVKTQSAVDNPMVLLTLKPEVVDAKKLSIEDQNQILRDVVDEVRCPNRFPAPSSILVPS
jgi:serine palmitoyltransferase